MVDIKRWLAHTFMPPWRWRLAFPAKLLEEIETAIRLSEHQHRGELRFAIENALSPARAWRGVSARQRATEVFASLHVWDTDENSGVLIYLLLADREVHILADRGIARRVPQAEWDTVAQAMRQAYHRGDYRGGSLEGIARITTMLASHFPADPDNPDELPNKPVIIEN